jgi:hypothetical protein
MKSMKQELDQISKAFFNITNLSGKEKISVGGFVSGHHYTLHFGTRSGTIDIHKTSNNGSHQTLLKASHYTVMRFIVLVYKPLLYGIKKHWYNRRINIGKLKKHNCFLFPASYESQELEKYFKVTKQGRKLRFRKDFPLHEFSDMILSPDDLLEDSSDTYMVYQFKKGKLLHQGMLIRRKLLGADIKGFIFCSKKDFNAFQRLSSHTFFNALHQLEFFGKDQVMKMIWENGIKQYYINDPKFKTPDPIADMTASVERNEQH